ncbi:fungal-specific transcription factor domain-containing protein [Fusarium avenaceum]|nr:fungal-specific transcription factor domain-containing protein [Fusarium avenaceum]
MAFAAETSDLYRHMGMAFYKRARSYLQAHDIDDITQTSISLGHAQAWALTSCFEAEHTMFAKASITLCSAIRVAQMLNLHQVDTVQHGENHPVDSIEMEERRRTWWTIFCFDRFVCATTGWPALIHDQNIRTRLPASDEAYAYGREEHAGFLRDQLTDAEPHSSFAGRVLTAHIFHRTIEHNSDNSQGQETQDFSNDAYWKRHSAIDNDLKFMLLMLPKSLCLPANYKNHNAVFVNTMLYTTTICLHRAALWKMKSNLQGLPSYMIRLSQDRLIPAAEEILNIFRMIPNLNATFANPLICFSAYMASLVFLSSTTPTQPDSQSEENLDFILKIMVAFGDNNLVANAVANEIVQEMKQCGIVSATMDKLNLQNTPIDIPLLATQRLYSSL